MDNDDQLLTTTSRIKSTIGGVADKLGNKYELSWAIFTALQCIQDDRRSITFEDIDPDLAEGSEFTFIDEQGNVAVTQVKRQHSIADHWTIAALRTRGIFSAALHHVSAGRAYHFSSMTPCASLRVLSERARQSVDLKQFTTHHLTQELKIVFDELTAPNVLCSAETAWSTLRGMWFEVMDEQQQVKTNAMIAATILEGTEESLIALAIGAVLLDNLRKRLRRRDLLTALRAYGIAPRQATAKQTSYDHIKAATAIWRNSVQRELLKPPLPRNEANDLVHLMHETRLATVVGAAGSGKSSVTHDAVSLLEQQGADVLAFRLDRLGTFHSTAELGKQLGLATSPVASLRIAADGRKGFLIVDQLDAVSLASGRLSERFDVIADLVHEAMAVDDVSVILVCRLFDVENDHRIRKLVAQLDVARLTIQPLPDQAVTGAVGAMGLEPSALTAKQRELLQSPLNLVLLQTVASQRNALSFTSRGSLFETFWQHKRQILKDQHPTIRFNDVLARVANEASDRQTLSIPAEILDAGDYISDALVLASEQVLAIDGDRVSFFHESFFDYVFARQWLSRQQSMVDFLCSHEQELFRRAQVRQILELLRERDASRFRFEVEALLTSKTIRYHIKATVMTVFADITTPSRYDVALLLRIIDSSPALTSHLWKQVCCPNWFNAVHEFGLIAEWLGSADSSEREQGIEWLGNAGDRNGAVVADLLRDQKSHPHYLRSLQWLIQRAELHYNRPLFDLLLSALQDGSFNIADDRLWLSGEELATHEPLWGIELLKACFHANPKMLVKNEEGAIPLLRSQNYGLTELIRELSQRAPQAYAETITPFLLAVMRETEFDQHADSPIMDRHFSFRLPPGNEARNLGDELYKCTLSALASWINTEPRSIKPHLETLAADRHDSAHALLYATLTQGRGNFTEWAAQLILEGGSRLRVGYASDIHWTSRALVEAIAPLVSDDVHALLEDELRDLPNSYEHGHSYGYTAFKFLSALDHRRLSPVGKRRLAEYQRKFGRDEPLAPIGMRSYVVGSPIQASATVKMSDNQWLSAMSKHNSDGRSDSDPSIGGARELSQMLKNRTTADPARFASLSLRMTELTHPAYPSAILWGFGEASISIADQSRVFNAIRHIARLGFDECDRWLGWSLRNLLDEVPLDIVEIIINRALDALDPQDDHDDLSVRDGEGLGQVLRQRGINTARGSLAEALGDLLIHDADGGRTLLVSPRLNALAQDSNLSVRSCVAHTIGASLKYARESAYEAFRHLIEGNDVLLTCSSVRDLMLYIGNVDACQVDPIIERALASDIPEVRRAGGSLAAFAALEWNRPHLMDRALSQDDNIRAGAILVCSARLDRTANSDLALAALSQCLSDKNVDIRKSVSEVVSNIRGQSLRPYTTFLSALIASPSYTEATPQLFFTLEEAPDKVDVLIDLAAHRFMDMHGGDVADIRTGAAGDAHYISELVIRGLAQASDGSRISSLLDIVDRLIELRVYGVDRTIDGVERA
jgi:hypothetical protein